MGKTGLIIQREYLTRVRKKSFLVMTFLGPVLIAGFVILAIYLSIGLQEEQRVLVVDDTHLFGDLKDGRDIAFKYTEQTLEEAKAFFKESDYTAILWIPENLFDQSVYGEANFKLFYKKQPGFMQVEYIRKLVDERTGFYRMKVNKIPPEIFKQLTAGVNIDMVKITETGREEAENQGRGYVGLFFAILIYFFIFMYSIQVMRGVIEEKTNRIVEVIISSVRPFQLMMGKIVGVALVGLTQFFLWVLLTSGLIFAGTTLFVSDKFDPEKIAENVQMSSEMMDEARLKKTEKIDMGEAWDLLSRINYVYFISMFLFYFLGGYLLYSALFAAIGAAVDNETETQQFMFPVTIPLILGFIIAEMAIQNPDGPAAFWASIIPLTSPVVMMVRVAIIPLENMVWQVLLSMALLVLSFFFVTWVAAKIYRTGILMYGKKVSYKELWRWLFFKG